MKMRTGIDCKGRKWKEIPRGQAKDLTTIKYKYITPICRVTGDFVNPNNSRAYWICQCDCGNQIIKCANDIVETSSCGCHKNEHCKVNLIGQRFGRLVVLEQTRIDNKHQYWWKCQCDCGQITETTTANLRSGNTASCGCTHLESSRRNCGYKDLSGQHFGYLTVIERAQGPDWSKKAYYRCLCDCGNETIAQGSELKSGHKRTCGCRIGLSRGEEKIKNILDEHNIQYLFNKVVFKDLITSGGGHGRYDFVLVDKQNKPYRLIEFDGMQHFKASSIYNNLDKQWNLEYTQANDKIKTQYALKHKIPLVRIPYIQLEHIDYEMIMGNNFLVKDGDTNA